MNIQEMVIKEDDDILLFYLDENGVEHSVVSTVENSITQDQGNSIIIAEAVEPDNATELNEAIIQEEADGESDIDTNSLFSIQGSSRWLKHETENLLTFYINNKDLFLNGHTKRKQLWAVACNTMLAGKDPTSCMLKLSNLKRMFLQKQMEQLKGNQRNWAYFDLCHRAFYNDSTAVSSLANVQTNHIEAKTDMIFSQHAQHITVPAKMTIPAQIPVPVQIPLSVQIPMPVQIPVAVKIPMSVQIPVSTPISVPTLIPATVKNENGTGKKTDNKVATMLQMYIDWTNRMKHVTNDLWKKQMWEAIATELGEEDADYWHKRFFNYKQHYLRLIDKRKEKKDANFDWPYMKYFDEIYKNDLQFQKKYILPKAENPPPPIPVTSEDNTLNLQPDWNIVEKTVLSKYYYDSFHEFNDSLIPNIFLWKEIGYLLDRSPEACELQYELMKKQHFDSLGKGSYNAHDRVPIAIIFDNIISREVELELEKNNKKCSDETWTTEEIDQLVRFVFDNAEMLKDSICYNVCWAKSSMLVNKTVGSCKKKWDELKSLYKSILNDKKEDPEMEIDWRYLELFDRIFDYGMNINAFDSFENLTTVEDKKPKSNVKKVNIKLENEECLSENELNGDEIEDSNSMNLRRKGEEKAFKILEFYQKNKEIFSTPHRKKTAIWEEVAKQVKMTATECAHRFRNLKQVYMAYLERECKYPEKPITWPYYPLCKKVFGYRVLKSKIMKKKDMDFEYREWSAKDIKLLIAYYSDNYSNINKNYNIMEIWVALAERIGKTETACRDKFMELRKSYRKLKTMLTRNSHTKVSWKYYSQFDEICSRPDNEDDMEIEYVERDYEVDTMSEVIKQEIQDDDDIQCIIVVPEGQDIEEALKNAQYIQTTDSIQKHLTSPTPASTKWTKKTKRGLLILYLNYLRSHRRQEIDTRHMWKEISEKLPNKTPLSCRKMFVRLKKRYLSVENLDRTKQKIPYCALLEKILAMKPKFVKQSKDVSLPISDTLQEALPEMDVQFQNTRRDETFPSLTSNYCGTVLESGSAENYPDSIGLVPDSSTGGN